jgi:hypothetical protein
VAEEARREHPAAVDDEEITRVEEVGEIPKRVMAAAACGPVEEQKPGGVTLRQRLLSDPLGREDVVEVSDLH